MVVSKLLPIFVSVNNQTIKHMYSNTDRNKANLLQLIKHNIDEELVIHYNCCECGDEQVTNPEQYTDDDINAIKKSDLVNIGLPCTNCSTQTTFVDTDSVFGVEVM